MRSASLFTPLTLGALALPSRVVMAPMTRNRAAADGTPTPLMATYYAQRAGAALIVSEMAYVSRDGNGYLNIPGMLDVAHAAAWRRVTEAVHVAGGRIALQLSHVGRISHPTMQPGGALPVAPSGVRPEGTIYTTRGVEPFQTPRALGAAELPRIVDDFARATRLARDAGFDGVEIHAGNGYLIDQFLRDGTNRRTDDYGGDATGRARLLLEIADAVAAEWTASRVGVRISPFNPYNDMRDSDPRATFVRVARLLSGRGLAYLHVIDDADGAGTEPFTHTLRAAFGGPLIANGGFGRERAEDALARGAADAVAFGTPFIANPDLPRRLALGLPLATPDRSTFYGGDERGYTDYPPCVRAA